MQILREFYSYLFFVSKKRQKLNPYKKKIPKARELPDFMRLDLTHGDKTRENQILTVLKELNRFFNNINGIPNGIAMAPLPAPKVKIKTLETV